MCSTASVSVLSPTVVGTSFVTGAGREGRMTGNDDEASLALLIDAKVDVALFDAAAPLEAASIASTAMLSTISLSAAVLLFLTSL